ncbi:GIY-YIG nuclease family protein [Pseudarthrobacter sp. B4EP4b]|uniref:GIY-YIG nuclease family protein n=1 Tax=Pseudarthrobacter sp. B4EP4b TaxID=2590664 RepID=UPI001153949A|nr:GIY-YIG nuclease family protein [Pseudarthrobacter sp. B4EP4b]
MAGSPLPGKPVVHFGERLRASKYSHRLKRDEYALPNKTNSSWFPREMYGEAMWASQAWMYEDEDHRVYADEFCELQREAALENFDLNKAFFRQLSAKDFEEALAEMLRKHKYLRPVTDLIALDGEMGVYVMVLGLYKQVYVGQSWDIRKRIKQHWSGVKQFDRLIFPDKETSILSIDSFRALDTTRIFAAKTIRGDQLERRLVNTFPPDFLLNRVDGGDRIMGGLFLPGEVKQRQLIADTPQSPA